MTLGGDCTAASGCGLVAAELLAVALLLYTFWL